MASLCVCAVGCVCVGSKATGGPVTYLLTWAVVVDPIQPSLYDAGQRPLIRRTPTLSLFFCAPSPLQHRFSHASLPTHNHQLAFRLPPRWGCLPSKARIETPLPFFPAVSIAVASPLCLTAVSLSVPN